MGKVATISAVVLLAVIGLSAYAFAVYLPSFGGPSANLGAPGSGTMNIYLADSPAHNASLKYLLINVTSITLKYSPGMSATASTTSSSGSTASTSTAAMSSSSSYSTTSDAPGSTSAPGQSGSENRYMFNVSSSLGTNVNLTKLQGSSVLLGSPRVPAGNVTGIVLQIAGAEAFWTNGNHTQLKVVANGKLMVPVHFTVHASGTTNLNLDLNPGDIHVSPGNGSVLSPVVHATAGSSGPGGAETTSTAVTESESSSASSSSS